MNSRIKAAAFAGLVSLAAAAAAQQPDLRAGHNYIETRVYSAEDVEEIRLILRLGRELGVNLAGIEIILKMRRQMQAMQQELEATASSPRHEPGSPVPDGAAAARGGLVRVADRQLRKLDVC